VYNYFYLKRTLLLSKAIYLNIRARMLVLHSILPGPSFTSFIPSPQMLCNLWRSSSACAEREACTTG
jgi:hypothetical protein